MVLTINADVAAVLAAAAGGQEPPPPPPLGDIESRRTMVAAMFGGLMAASFPRDPSVKTKDFQTKSADGTSIMLRWFYKEGAPSKPGPAYLHIHGGGLIAASVDVYDPSMNNYVSKTGIPLLSVDYRLAPENPFPKPVEDVYAGLLYLHEHASELGVDTNRIGVIGDSAGGNLAASVTIYARDKKGPAIAKQVLIYPMLDDRSIVAEEASAPYLVWSAVDNETAWNAYLGSKRGSDSVSPHAAPARLTDFSGLPQTYIETGELDLFRDEDVQYALKLGKAGISTELHVLPGLPHGYDVFAPNADIVAAAIGQRLHAIKSIASIDSAKL